MAPLLHDKHRDISPADNGISAHVVKELVRRRARTLDARNVARLPKNHQRIFVAKSDTVWPTEQLCCRFAATSVPASAKRRSCSSLVLAAEIRRALKKDPIRTFG